MPEETTIIETPTTEKAPERVNPKQRLKEITDSIERGIQELFTSERYMEYLKTMSRFHRYSLNNTLLISMQRPDATLVAGFNKWRDQFGRNVMRGQKGIKIIAPTPYKVKKERDKVDPETHAPILDGDGRVITEEVEIQIPMFRVVSVFDVAQTEGKALPSLASNLMGNVEQFDVFMEALKRSAPVPLAFEQMPEEMDGYYQLEEKRIAIREGMSEVQTVSAAIHEITHSKLHNRKQERLAAVGNETSDVSATKDKRTEEVEAESVSFAVCAYYGIKTDENSFGYIAAWSKDKELPELKASLETINKTASALIEDVDRNFKEVLKERGLDVATEQLDSTVQEQPAPLPEQTQGVYKVENIGYLEIQKSDDVYDFTLLNNGYELLDGGQLDAPELSFDAAKTEIVSSFGIEDKTLTELPPTEYEEARDAAQTQTKELAAIGMTQARVTQAFEAASLYYDADPERLSFSGRGVDGAEYAFASWREAAAWIDSAPFDSPEISQAIERVLHPEHYVEHDVKTNEETPDYPMPDPTLDVDALIEYGYTDGDMLPLSTDKAIELYEKDIDVYMLYEGNGAGMVFDRDDIDGYSGMFGIKREDWEESREYLARIEGYEVTQSQLESAFVQNPADAFAIYQLKRGEELRDYRFEPYARLQAAGYSVDRANYELVYTDTLTHTGDKYEKLNELYQMFNLNRPEDFKGHSLSVSDIIALKQNGAVSCHYVDSWGYKELLGFIQPTNYLQNAEMALEDDYGMIDGVINNGPKQPTVTELETQARSGQPISLMDLADAVHREKKAERPSVLAKLREYSANRPEKSETAQKSAEMEL